MPRTWFDEAFDLDGRLREPYSSLSRRLGWNPTQPSAQVAERLRLRPFGDDTRIFPIPVVLAEADYRSTIQAGVAQRAAALTRLFEDLVLGTRQICAAGLGLTEDILGMITSSEGTSLAELRETWSGRRPAEIRFIYGPDLLRDAAGRWVVIEDNVGCVGGSADAYFVTSCYREAVGLPRGAPRPDLAIVIEHLLRQLRREPGRTVAVLGNDATDQTFGLRIDENARRRRMLSDLAIPVVSQSQVRSSRPGGQLAVDEVTVLNFAVDDSWVDLFRRPGLVMLNAPGTAILGSKALLPFTNAIIRFYTGEEPILTTAQTHLLHEVRLPHGPGWVVKAAAGCQGSEVFMLDRLSSDQRDILEARLQGDWSRSAAVAQRFIEPARLVPTGFGGWDGYQLELRPVTYVLGREVYVGEQPVGKGVSTFDARRLNNISAGACYVPVLRE